MRDYVYSIAGKSVSAATQMVMLAILAMQLDPGALATLLAVYSGASIVAALGDLGLGTLAARERAYGDISKADHAIHTADRLAISTALPSATILILLAFIHPPFLPCAPLFLWAPIERATETRTLRLIADGRVGRVALLNGVRRLIGLALFLPLTLIIPSDWAFTVALVASAALAQGVAMGWVRLSVGEADVSMTGLLREAMPFTFTSLSGQLRNLDVPLVSAFIGNAPAAAYGLGARFASPMLLVYSAISGLILVRVRHKPRRHVAALLAVLLSGTAVVSVLAIVCLPLLTGLLTPYVSWIDEHLMLIIALVATSYMFAGAGIILGSICVAFELQSLLARINIATTLTSLALVAMLSVSTGSGVLSAFASMTCFTLQAGALTYLAFTRHPDRMP